MPTKQEFLQEALKSAVKSTTVPALMLLKVIKNYHDTVSAHKRDMTVNHAILRASKKERERHEEQLKQRDGQIASYDDHLKRLSSIDWTGMPGKDGDPGSPGINGIDSDEERIIDSVLAQIPIPKDGKPGKDGKDAEIEHISRHVIEIVKKEQLLDLSHIKGAQGFIKDGVKYRFEELMHGGGGKSSGGFSIIAVSGVINDTNTSFIAASTPTLLNINGAFYQQTGGAITWSLSGLSITTSSPVGQGGSIFAV